MNIEQIIREKKGTVVDVRTAAEFQGGHVADSINIPLPELNSRIQEIRTFEGPLILCCASGGRSSLACNYLNQQGIQCVNAGSWMDVNYLQSLTV